MVYYGLLLFMMDFTIFGPSWSEFDSLASLVETSRFPRFAPVLVWTVWECPSLRKDGRGGPRNGIFLLFSLTPSWIAKRVRFLRRLKVHIDRLGGKSLKPQTGSNDRGSRSVGASF